MKTEEVINLETLKKWAAIKKLDRPDIANEIQVQITKAELRTASWPDKEYEATQVARDLIEYLIEDVCY